MSRLFDLVEGIDTNAPFADRRQLSFTASEPRAAVDSGSNDRWSDEEAMSLVQRIFLHPAGSLPKVAVFAGVGHDGGCGRVALSVAETLAKNSLGPVCLVEANLRSPDLTQTRGETTQAGLTDALLQEGPIRSFISPMRTEELWLLSSGSVSTDSAKLLSSELVKTRLAELRREFNYVIVHAPSLTAYADAVGLARATDGLVLVLEAGDTRREAAQMAVASLRSAKIPILGAVLNNRKFPIPEMIYRRL